MPEGAANIAAHVFQAREKLLLDANVWLFLYGPCGPQRAGDRRVAVYSDAFKRMRQADSAIYMDVLVLSEFVNRYARLRHQQTSDRVPFKQFRRSGAFRTVARAIADAVRRILAAAMRVESGFAALNADDLVDEYAGGGVDFNDQVLARLCKAEGLTLVTDDGDFRGQGVALLSANPRLKRL